MKRHLKPVAILPTLSVEEEAIMVDEQNAIVQDIERDHQDVARLTDTDIVVNDAISVIETVEHPAIQDKQLLAAVGDMAVAGSDADGSELLPSFGEGPDVSTESFVASVKEKIKKMWEAIKTTITRIWESIKRFFDNIVGFFSGSAKRATRLRELLDRYKKGIDALENARSYWGKKQWMSDMETKSRYADEASKKGKYIESVQSWDRDRTNKIMLTIDGQLPSSFPQAIGNLYSTAWTLIERLPEATIKIEKDINHTLDQITTHPAEKEKILQSFCDRSREELKQIVRELGLTVSEGKNTPIRYTPMMLGNIAVAGNLFFTDQQTLEHELEDLGNLELKTVVLAGKKEKDIPDIGYIKSVPEIEKILATIEAWLADELPKINQKIERANREKSQFFTQVNGTFNKLQDDMSSDEMQNIRSLVYISGRLTSMIGRSIPEYLQEAHKVTTIVLDYATQSFISILFDEEEKNGGKKETGAAGKTMLSNNLQKFIKHGDVLTIRKTLENELEDKKLGAGDLQAIAKEVEKQVPNLWVPFEIKAFAREIDDNEQNWNKDYLGNQLVYLDTNFSKKRWDHIVLVRRVVGL